MWYGEHRMSALSCRALSHQRLFPSLSNIDQELAASILGGRLLVSQVKVLSFHNSNCVRNLHYPNPLLNPHLRFHQIRLISETDHYSKHRTTKETTHHNARDSHEHPQQSSRRVQQAVSKRQDLFQEVTGACQIGRWRPYASQISSR